MADDWNSAVGSWDTDTVIWDAAPGTTVDVTGLGLTVSVGTVSVVAKANVTVTGQELTASLGTISVTGKAVINVTSPALSVNVGGVSVTAGGSIGVGVSSPTINASLGTLSVSGKANVTIVASAGAGAWTPNLLAGLAVHIDASTLGLANGASVSSWPNPGSGADPTIVGSPNPVMRTNALNSLPVVTFTALEGRLRWFGTTGVDAPFTLAYLASMTTTRVNPARVMSGIYPPMNILFGWYGVQKDMCYAGFFGGSAAATVPGEWKMYSSDSTVGGGSIGFWSDGTTLTGAGGGGQTLNGDLAFGGYDPANYDQMPDFELAEVVLYNSQLSTDDRQKVEGYLAHKWGRQASLDAGHPYKAAPPAGAGGTGTDLQLTVSVGTATVAVKQSITVAGFGLTVSVGTVTVSTQQTTSVSVTGLQLSMSVGTATVTGKANVNVTGQGVTSFAGTASVSGKAVINVTGQGLACSAGTVSVAGKANVSVTGQGLTASVGNVTLRTGFQVTGFGLAINVGSVTVALPRSVNVTGQSLTVGLGTVDFGIGSTIQLTTLNALTAAVGSVAITVATHVAVDGQEIAVFGAGVGTEYDYAIQLDPLEGMTVSVGQVYSPNWGDRPEEIVDENWVWPADGGHGSWTPVPGTENSWHSSPALPDELWTKQIHKPNEWT